MIKIDGEDPGSPENPKMLKIPICSRSKSSIIYIETPDKPLQRLICWALFEQRCELSAALFESSMAEQLR